MPACAVCGYAGAESGGSCPECGTPATTPGAQRRKVVTVVFCDLVESTALGAAVDPEAFRMVLARYFARMKAIVERHGGVVEKFIGDAVVAVFGVPAVHEDDALRGLRAALEMRTAVADLDMQTRIGVNSGEVITGTGERLVAGDAVNVAARLEQAAGPGEVVLGERTLRLAAGGVEAEPLGPVRLKGKAAPVRAWRLVSVSRAPPERAFDSPLIGRTSELRALEQALERAGAAAGCELVTLVGSAGLGKSRLVAEFIRGVAATVVRGRCLPYGDAITYWPVVEVLTQLDAWRAALDLDPGAERALAVLLAGEGESSTGEIARAVRKLLEAVAADRPLVAVFDDIQWGQDAFLDLLEHVALASTGRPILVLCMARPDLLDRRDGWGGVIRLEPLDAEEARRLLSARTGSRQLDPELEERILARSAGNPLFVEEMAALLLESGGRAVAVPPTLAALLAARLDQLDPAERAVLECGAVEGEVFHRGSVEALTPGEARLTTPLTVLVRRELIRPDTAQVAGEDAYRFRHLLVRDAVYEATSKATRAELHERLAAWLQERAADLVEIDELIGHHLEQAFRYREELGLLDERAHRLARRAAQRLAAAARPPFLRKDARAGVSLISRAAALLPADAAGRVNLIPSLRVIQGAAGDMDWAHHIVDDALAAGDERTTANARVQEGFLRLFTGAGVAPAELIEVARRAIAVLEDSDDELGLARAWRLIAEAHYLARRAGPSAEATEHALVHIRRAGDVLEESENVEWLAVTLMRGPAPVPDAIRRCERLLDDVAGNAAAELIVANALANLMAMRGRSSEALRLVARARRLREERVGAAWFFPDEFSAQTLLDGPAAAADELQRAYEVQKRIGGTNYLSTISALLARARLAEGRDDEAEELTRECEAAVRPNDVQANILWRGTRARVLARRGRPNAALALAEEAVTFAAQSDFLETHGHALVDLADVLRLAGRRDEARDALERAVERYVQKGHVTGAAATRALIDDPLAPTPSRRPW